MHVKDYLQALSDEGRIRVEKIGSGNWYWSFAGDEKKNKADVLGKLREEKSKVEARVGELRGRLEEAGTARGKVREEGKERDGLMEKGEALRGEVEALRTELMGYSENDPVEVETRRVEVVAFKDAAARWTDNIYVLEGYLGRLTGGDREALEQIRAMYYGSEYVEGEGLRGL